ncbi:hypothetical protein [Qipengyuania sp. JC766]
MSPRAKRVAKIVLLVLAIPAILWLAYNAGFWLGASGTRTTP